jgi:hypothetical protein
MAATPALPFYLRRKQDVIAAHEVTSTTERIHGLLRLEGGRVVVQWRLSRQTEWVGAQIRTDQEYDPVREVVLPLDALAGAVVRASGWRRIVGPQVVLTAADLRTFEELGGAAGLRQQHPATLQLRIARSDVLLAQEFASELNLALAEAALSRLGQAVRGPAGGTDTLRSAPSQNAALPVAERSARPADLP